jgi:hypothetical protein
MDLVSFLPDVEILSPHFSRQLQGKVEKALADRSVTEGG